MVQFIDKIDFGVLYQQHFKEMQRPISKPKQWDSRAKQIPLSWQKTPYVKKLIKNLNLETDETVLDIGCGAGDITLPLAENGHTVHALDFSQAMLHKLRQRAAKADLTDRIHTYHLDWFQPWASVTPCDVVIASRSTLVADMQAALEKMHAFARKRVFLTYPAEAGARIGPQFPVSHVGAGRIPPYFYIPAILYQHGQWPRLSYIDDIAQNKKSQQLSKWVLVTWDKQPWLNAS